MRETVLCSTHESLGARMVPFAGWKMPVQYSGILSEAEAVRNRSGLFDLGHMGRVRVSGRDAEPFLQRLRADGPPLTSDPERTEALAYMEASERLEGLGSRGAVDPVLQHMVSLCE